LIRTSLRATASLASALWRFLLVPFLKGVGRFAAKLRPEALAKHSAAGAAAAVAWERSTELTGRMWAELSAEARRVARRAGPWILDNLRGLRMRLEGTQVLRRLQPGRYQYTYWLFGELLNRGRWSKDRAALIQRLSEAWEQEVQLRGRPFSKQGTLPNEEAANERRQAQAQGDYVERVAIEHVPVSFASLLQPATLQEPQFQELLVAYRLQEPMGGDELWPSSSVQAPLQRPIYIRRFWDVPMKDIKLALPREAWRVRGRPLDMIKLDLITLFGSIGVVSQLLGPRSYFALFPLVVLIVRTYLGHRRTRVYHASVTSSMLFDRCLDKDRALAQQLPRAAEEQVFSECALAYWALVVAADQQGDEAWVPQADLERSAKSVARSLLEDAGLPTAGVQPRLGDALRRLETWGLAVAKPAGEQEGAGEGQMEGEDEVTNFVGEPAAPQRDATAPGSCDSGTVETAGPGALEAERRHCWRIAVGPEEAPALLRKLRAERCQ